MPKNEAIIKMAKLKALGHMLPGRLDMELYFKGVLHVFDFKVGNDHIKPKQQEYINAIISQGGKAYEIRSVAQFIAIIEEIIK